MIHEGVTLLLAGLFLVVAALYASVGQAGASGYLAVMAIAGLPPEVMRPTSLTLNVLVAAIGSVKFYRAGCFSWRLFWPFAVVSVPLALAGGSLTLPVRIYQPLVGAVLLFAAYRLARKPFPSTGDTRPPHVAVALPTGAAIGLLAGLTGIGGGIILTPLVLFMRWADPKTAFGVSAPFILVNSIAALVGLWIQTAPLPGEIAIWAGAVIAGGWLGATYGSRHASAPAVQRLLAVVLLIAAVRLLAER